MATPGFQIQKEAVNRPQWKTLQQFQSYTQYQQSQQNMLKTTEAKRERDYARTRAARAQQDTLQKSQDQFAIDQYERVGELAETGYSPFDKSKDDYFYGEIDKFINIKNAIGKTITRQEGAKAMAMINDQVNTFKDAAPQVLAQAKLLEERLKIPKGEPGALSVLNSTEQQRVLLNLIHGGDVQLINHEGQMVLFSPPGSEGLPEGGMVNINELMNLEASGIEYSQTVPDVSVPLETAFKQVAGDANGWNEQTYKDPETGEPIGQFMTSETIERDGKKVTVRTMDEQQRQNIATAMRKTNVLQPTVDAHGKTIWADMMGRDEPYDANENAGEVIDFLANKAIDDYAGPVGIESVIGRRDKEKPSSTAKAKYWERKEAETDIEGKAPDMLDALLDLNAGAFENMELMDELIGNVGVTKDGNIKFSQSTGDRIGASKLSIENKEGIINALITTYGGERRKYIEDIVNKWYKDNWDNKPEVKKAWEAKREEWKQKIIKWEEENEGDSIWDYFTKAFKPKDEDSSDFDANVYDKN